MYKLVLLASPAGLLRLNVGDESGYIYTPEVLPCARVPVRIRMVINLTSLLKTLRP